MLIGVGFVSAIDLPDWKDKYVNDFAGILNGNQSVELRAVLAGVDVDTTAEVSVVTIAECAPYDISQYSIELARKWTIGKKEKDNGFLILYCQAENRIRGEVGRGLEGILPDSKVGRLLDENYVPLRDAGDVPTGIVNFAKQIAQVIEDNKEEVIAGKAGVSVISSVFIYIFFAIFIILFIWLWSAGAKSNARVGDKSSQGVKKSGVYNFVSGFISIGLAIFLFIFINPFIGIVAYFILNAVFKAVRGVRCDRDGLKMNKIGREGSRETYKCPKGHVGWIVAAAAAGYWMGHHGFGGSSSGGGFGGGGFGGGGFGGGGAGR